MNESDQLLVKLYDLWMKGTDKHRDRLTFGVGMDAARPDTHVRIENYKAGDSTPVDKLIENRATLITLRHLEFIEIDERSVAMGGWAGNFTITEKGKERARILIDQQGPPEATG